MNIGSLRNQIQVQEPVITKDQYGASEESFETSMTIRAQVKYVSGNMSDNKEIFHTQVVQFTTYFRDIKPVYRIRFKEQNYRILFVEEIGQKEGLLITSELINE